MAATKVLRGVNLTGWLTLEPWVTPEPFARTATVDEVSLAAKLGKDEYAELVRAHRTSFIHSEDFRGLRREALMRCACRYRGMSLNLKTHHINRALIWWTRRLSGPKKLDSTSSSYLPSIRGFPADKTVLPEAPHVLAFLARKALKLSKSLHNAMHTVWDFWH